MADPHAKKDEHKEEKKDDHAHGHEEKKTFSQRLIDAAVKVLLVVIFLYVIGALLGMLFPAVQGILNTVGNGLTGMGAELLRTTAAMGVFTGSVAAIVARFLFLFVIVVVALKLMKAIGEWAKK